MKSGTNARFKSRCVDPVHKNKTSLVSACCVNKCQQTKAICDHMQNQPIGVLLFITTDVVCRNVKLSELLISFKTSPSQHKPFTPAHTATRAINSNSCNSVGGCTSSML